MDKMEIIFDKNRNNIFQEKTYPVIEMQAFGSSCFLAFTFCCSPVMPTFSPPAAYKKCRTGSKF